MLHGRLPIWLLVFYRAKHASWAKEDFKKKYGSALEGNKVETGKWLPLVLMGIFLARWASFAMIVVMQPRFFWMQIFIQFCASVALVICLVYFQPMETTFDNLMESYEVNIERVWF